MSDRVGHGPLGETVDYIDTYSPDLLHPIARQEGRDRLGLVAPLPFHGVDIWNAWELSWLNERGKPEVAIGEFRFPAESPNIVESKSFKLYLNSFNQSRMASTEVLQACLEKDLSAACGAPVVVTLYRPSEWTGTQGVTAPLGLCLDELDISPQDYEPNADLLTTVAGEVAEEVLYSHLLRSRCPVTGQPDWATVFIDYRGDRINREGLLAYLISFRLQNDFHEQCVEQVFRDILERCAPKSLTVCARYLRRGGLDINPWRSTNADEEAPNTRAARQ
jgi:7-cyano-7-deazaguanine reductase